MLPFRYPGLNSLLEDDDQLRLRLPRPRPPPPSSLNPSWREAGRELKSLADQFARSRERAEVLARAEAVDVRSLDMAKFMELLRGLFHGGEITRERVLVLFFFCSDLAIRAARCKLNGMLGTLTRWSLIFIRGQVGRGP